MSATKDPEPRSIAPWTAPPALPVRQYSFTDWQTNNPTAPPPGDRMDAEYDRANAAISQTITWAEISLNTDGSLRAGTVGESQLVSGLFDDIAQDIIDEVQPLVDQAQGFASAAAASKTAAAGSASSASAANTAAQGSATTASNAAVLASTANTSAQGYATTAQTAAANAANADNHATGEAALAQDYADVTQAWAEHMPDTIPPNILAVMGVTGDHWSSRWWANQAAITTSDAIDEINDAGDFWLNQLPGALTAVKTLLYRATANQTIFPLTTADLGGNVYTISATTPDPIEVYANGVRLPSDTPNPGSGDWTLNPATSTVTFLTPLLAGTMVQVDVLSKPLTTTGFLPITGGTMTGPLTLAADPLTAMQAATRQYVDARATTVAGSYLPLAGGTISGPLTVNGPITGTGIGWDIGDIPGPLVAATAGVTTYPALHTTNRVILERAVNAASDSADFHFRRYTNFTGGTTANINKTVTIDTITGAGDGTVQYGLVCTTTNGSTTTPSGRVMSAVIQAWKTAGNGICTALNTSGNEQQGTPSSLSGPVTAQEWDLFAGGVDDGANNNRFGGVGLRQMIHAAFSQQSQSVVSHYTAGIWFSTQAILNDSGGTISSYTDSLINCSVNTQTRNFLDARGAIPPTGVTDPVAAVRMSHEHIIDFNGGASLTSPPGSYLQYTTTGPDRLRYMSAGVEQFSIDDGGDVDIAGKLGIATTTPPPGAVQLEVGGTASVGIRTSGAFSTAFRCMSDQRISFEDADGHYLQYRAATSRLYYVVAGVDRWSVDASGNMRCSGTVTPSATP